MPGPERQWPRAGSGWRTDTAETGDKTIADGEIRPKTDGPLRTLDDSRRSPECASRGLRRQNPETTKKEGEDAPSAALLSLRLARQIPRTLFAVSPAAKSAAHLYGRSQPAIVSKVRCSPDANSAGTLFYSICDIYFASRRKIPACIQKFIAGVGSPGKIPPGAPLGQRGARATTREPQAGTAELSRQGGTNRSILRARAAWVPAGRTASARRRSPRRPQGSRADWASRSNSAGSETGTPR